MKRRFLFFYLVSELSQLMLTFRSVMGVTSRVYLLTVDNCVRETGLLLPLHHPLNQHPLLHLLYLVLGLLKAVLKFNIVID